ncbi:MAG TPA: ribonuclease M5 [Bacilli bacterium]|nr:ribonuclease M5 [Bacilli bacterium]
MGYKMLDLSSSVIVVEGKSDVALLSSIIKSNFVTTNGSEVSRETINYLKILSKTYPIIILTDPDGPGRIIRSRLEQELNDVQHIFLNKKDCIKKNKVGVAEADISTIRLAFEHIIPGPSVDVGNLNTTHLLNLLLVGNEEAGARRKFIGEYYHFGQSNAKTLLKRLNQINISFNEIKEVLINAGYKC